MRTINKFNVLILKKFNSRQHYLNVNGHPMPLLLESVSDESNIDDFNSRRFYCKNFEMMLSGYLLDEDDFEMIPTVNRLKVTEELMVRKTFKKPKIKVVTLGAITTINMFFKIKKSRGYFSFKADFDTKITEIYSENISSIVFSIEGVVKTIPFIVSAGEDIKVTFTKENNNIDSSFELNGQI
jgi:hypothetical protein